jgi:uncharacterized protein (DUF983 family)
VGAPADGNVVTLERQPRSARLALAYLARALRLRCPICGISPVFPPLRATRSLAKWFTPVEGCPRCRYRYERESGYFLLATWGIGYISVVALALLGWLAIANLTDLGLTATLLWIMVPIPFVSVLFARHAKAFWLAFDHFWDPAAGRRAT